MKFYKQIPSALLVFGIVAPILFALLACKQEQKQNKIKEEVQNEIPVEVAEPLKEETELSYELDSTWVNLLKADPEFILDIRYATENNFVGEQIYECGKCFLRKEAAAALLKVHSEFKKQGYRIKLFDCYRPHPAQQKLWDKVPNPNYVTPPWKGSNHNKGLAVDLTLVDEDGDELAMGSDYDFFGKEAHHDYMEHDENILANRLLLKNTLKEVGFSSIRTEWWHYNFYGVKYEVSKLEWECL